MSTTLSPPRARTPLGAAVVEGRLCSCDCMAIHPETDLCWTITETAGSACTGCDGADGLGGRAEDVEELPDPVRTGPRQAPAYAVIGTMVLADVAAGLLGYGTATAGQALIHAGATAFTTVVLLVMVDIMYHQPQATEVSQ